MLVRPSDFQLHSDDDFCAAACAACLLHIAASPGTSYAYFGTPVGKRNHSGLECDRSIVHQRTAIKS